MGRVLVNVEIEETYLKAVMGRYGLRTNTEAVEFALRHLAGARSDAREADLRRLLLRFHLYPFDAVADFDGAVRIYRQCRRVGITPRGLIDCMIAAVAWRRQAAVLTCDTDLVQVARVVGIRLDQQPQAT